MNPQRQAQLGTTVVACSHDFVRSMLAIGRSVLQLLELDVGTQDRGHPAARRSNDQHAALRCACRNEPESSERSDC